MSKDISEYSSDELYKLAEEKRNEEFLSLRPRVVEFKNITEKDIQNLIDLADSYMKERERSDEIDTHYAYETLMEFVYGDKVWDYVNGLGG